LFVYIALSLIYALYLKISVGSRFYPDYMTNLVAIQAESLLNTFGYTAQVIPHPDEPSMKLIINGKYLARVIEGCNAISVINLFIAFIVAFSGKLKETVVYILSGSALIYTVNLLRIVILSIGMYHYPWHRDILHTVIFPGIIYGMVFLLWMVWVRRFATIHKKT
jgi:exosortase family protein XrtF